MSRIERSTSVRVALRSLAAAAIFSAVLTAQTPAPIVIDASAPATAPDPANYTYVADEGRSPSGHVLGLNAQYLTLDGNPWLPVMGEMHYSRVPEAEWETEILKMKSAGVQIIATYLIWIHHEEVEGQWDWTGQKDLRRFVQLCAKHGMYVVPRIGPWSHAEVRNGGFPDWLLAKTTQQRSNDPTYLHYVDLYDKQIGEQLKGLMWNEGGPVIAIQLENEYRSGGPTRGTAHILKLKQMARDAGLKVPFYTVTGWDGASIPKGEVLPVYGGYPDAPWDASIQKLPPSEVYNFRFGSRVTGDMGAQNGAAPTGNAANFTLDTPFMTAEMGGGMQVTYHRRPIVSADDIAAMMPVMLGSGVNLYGSYMFHGGENPDGKLTTLEETIATGHYNDLPQKTYDFEAPIGEFGDERESLLKLKTWNYFLNDFGSLLAPMQPHKPNVLPVNARDLSVPRVAARTSGQSGFLFVNNHIRGYPMPARENFQVTIKLPDNRSVTLPSFPMTLEPDAYFVWPFNLDLGGLRLRYATAQPLAILGTRDAPVYAFFGQLGVTEFVIDDQPGLKVDFIRQPQQVIRKDGAITIYGGAGEKFTLPNGKTVTLLLLNHSNAEHGWKIESNGTNALLVTQQQAFVEGDVATLQDLSENNFNAFLIPSGANLMSLDPAVPLRRGADLSYTGIISHSASVVQLAATQTKAAGVPTPLPEGFKPSSRPRVVAAAPTETDWSRAAIWSIPLPRTTYAQVPHSSAQRMSGMQYFLRLHYTGDVARLSAPIAGQAHLLDDNFADGRPWLVGLSRFAPQLAQSNGKLEFSIYPLRSNPPIFFEPGLEPKANGPQAALESVELVTQYTLKLKLVPSAAKKR